MSRLTIVCFDIHDPKRLRKVSKEMENFGTRVQYSLFECFLNREDFALLKDSMAQLIDQDVDHIRYYRLCGKDSEKILFDGKGELHTDDDYLLL